MNLLRDPLGRRVLFGALYFAEGAPIGFVWWTLPVILRRAGWTKAAIGGLVGALVLPWAFKFVWAPLVDALRGPRFGFRAWIAVSQVAMAGTLLPLLWLDLAAVDGGLLAALLVGHAFAAATQDVAIDGLAVRAVAAGERGAVQGWMQVGMLTGRGVFGGLILLAREAGSDAGIVACLLLAIVAILPVHLCWRADEAVDPRPLRQRWVALLRDLGHAFRVPAMWWVLAFAATAGVTLEMVGALAGPWMVDRGLDDAAIAWFLALPVVVGLAVGALVGGMLSDRFGRRVTLTACVGVMALAAVGLWAAADAGHETTIALLAVVYATGGAFTAASYGLFMDATEPRLGATQFSAFTGATNLCESWSAGLAGSLATSASTGIAVLVAGGLGLLALPLTRRAARPQEADRDQSRPSRSRSAT